MLTWERDSVIKKRKDQKIEAGVTKKWRYLAGRSEPFFRGIDQGFGSVFALPGSGSGQKGKEMNE